MLANALATPLGSRQRGLLNEPQARPMARPTPTPSPTAQPTLTAPAMGGDPRGVPYYPARSGPYAALPPMAAMDAQANARTARAEDNFNTFGGLNVAKPPSVDYMGANQMSAPAVGSAAPVVPSMDVAAPRPTVADYMASAPARGYMQADPAGAYAPRPMDSGVAASEAFVADLMSRFGPEMAQTILQSDQAQGLFDAFLNGRGGS